MLEKALLQLSKTEMEINSANGVDNSFKGCCTKTFLFFRLGAKLDLENTSASSKHMYATHFIWYLKNEWWNWQTYLKRLKKKFRTKKMKKVEYYYLANPKSAIFKSELLLLVVSRRFCSKTIYVTNQMTTTAPFWLTWLLQIKQLLKTFSQHTHASEKNSLPMSQLLSLLNSKIIKYTN